MMRISRDGIGMTWKVLERASVEEVTVGSDGTN